MLFEQGVSARKFKSTKVNIFEHALDTTVLNRFEKEMEGAQVAHIENRNNV